MSLRWPTPDERTHAPTSARTDPGAAEVKEALQEGKTVSTNGPFVEFTLDGVGIGGTLRRGPGMVRGHVRVLAPAWIDVRRVLIVVNGVVDSAFMVRGRSDSVRFDEDIELYVRNSGFVQVRVEGDEPIPSTTTDPLAVTSIYLGGNIRGGALDCAASFRRGVSRSRSDARSFSAAGMVRPNSNRLRGGERFRPMLMRSRITTGSTLVMAILALTLFFPSLGLAQTPAKLLLPTVQRQHFRGSGVPVRQRLRRVTFSEKVNVAQATTAANYSFCPTLTISSVTLQENGQTAIIRPRPRCPRAPPTR